MLLSEVGYSISSSNGEIALDATAFDAARYMVEYTPVSELTMGGND